jgi:formate/nitrite transporter
MPSPAGFDAYAPEEIAERVETYGTLKARLSPLALFMLGVIGGGFIGLGAMAQTVVMAKPELGIGAARIIGGLFFAMGYIMAIIAGAEVFTSNNLLVMSWAGRQVTTKRLLYIWGLVLFANAVGAVGLAIAVVFSGHVSLHDGEVARTAIAIGAKKAGEPFISAFFKGVLGNLLIAMGVWLAMAGRSVTDKVLGPWLPIAALPIAGFEHSVGNLYYLPMAGILSVTSPEFADGTTISVWGALRNLTAVTLGNIVGGGGMVAMVYHLIYRRPRKIRLERIEDNRSE